MAEALVGAALSVRDALTRGAATLSAAGCETPRLDAELLLCSALEVTRARLVLDAGHELDPLVLAGYEALLRRRSDREPVAYIIGHKAFRHITLGVDERALIPRPETELLVDVGIALGPGALVADVGTGSGAVALALKHERPDLTVVGIDLSAAPLELARENRLRLELEVDFVEADLLDSRPYDAILANLPYVADGAELAPEISLYEPSSALFGGPDGLDLVRRLVSVAGDVSLLALEVGFDQADAVADLLTRAGFRAVERLRDLAGHERVIVGRR